MSQFAISTASPGPHLAPPLATSSPLAASPPGGKCCDTGRVLYTDPVSGHSVCSCQYGVGSPSSHLLAYQRLASAGLPGLMYGCDSPYLQALQAQAQAPSAPGKESSMSLGPAALGAPGWPYGLYYPYGEAALSPYGLPAGYGFGLDGSRRKNATRETTSTLKAWLNEHKKNPYPTKGEKIMLAIITKMTLTQVSTWFANARRRLKKENKMTWEPRNRTDDDDGDSDAEVAKSDDDTKPDREGSPADRAADRASPAGGTEEEEAQSPVKPRIWSLADMAMSGSSPASRLPPLPPAFLPGLPGGGKLLLPFPRPHHSLPYGRPESSVRAPPPPAPPAPAAARSPSPSSSAAGDSDRA